MSENGTDCVKLTAMSENGLIIYTCASQSRHSKAESILNLYKNSTKYKISKMLLYAKIDEIESDPYNLVSLVQDFHISNIS